MSVNSTDYDFPDGWGLFTPEQKDAWFKRERCFRQACRQNTAFGRRYRAVQDDSEQEPRGIALQRALKQAGRGGFRYDS